MSDDYFKDIEELERKVKKLKPRLDTNLKDPKLSFGWGDLDEIEKLLDKAENTPPPRWQQWIQIGKDWCLTISAYLGLLHLLYQTYKLFCGTGQ